MRQSSSKTLKVLLSVLKDVRAKSTLTPDGRRTDRRRRRPSNKTSGYDRGCAAPPETAPAPPVAPAAPPALPAPPGVLAAPPAAPAPAPPPAAPAPSVAPTAPAAPSAPAPAPPPAVPVAPAAPAPAPPPAVPAPPGAPVAPAAPPAARQRREYHSRSRCGERGSRRNGTPRAPPDAARAGSAPPDTGLSVATPPGSTLLVQPYGLHSACCPCACMRVCMEWYEGMK
ncbi:unnamed protein product [Closterium sp. NIES-54]